MVMISNIDISFMTFIRDDILSRLQSNHAKCYYVYVCWVVAWRYTSQWIIINHYHRNDHYRYHRNDASCIRGLIYFARNCTDMIQF